MVTDQARKCKLLRSPLGGSGALHSLFSALGLKTDTHTDDMDLVKKTRNVLTDMIMELSCGFERDERMDDDITPRQLTALTRAALIHPRRGAEAGTGAGFSPPTKQRW